MALCLIWRPHLFRVAFQINPTPPPGSTLTRRHNSCGCGSVQNLYLAQLLCLSDFKSDHDKWQIDLQLINLPWFIKQTQAQHSFPSTSFGFGSDKNFGGAWLKSRRFWSLFSVPLAFAFSIAIDQGPFINTLVGMQVWHSWTSSRTFPLFLFFFQFSPQSSSSLFCNWLPWVWREQANWSFINKTRPFSFC